MRPARNRRRKIVFEFLRGARLFQSFVQRDLSSFVLLPDYECRMLAKFRIRMLLICLELRKADLRAVASTRKTVSLRYTRGSNKEKMRCYRLASRAGGGVPELHGFG